MLLLIIDHLSGDSHGEVGEATQDLEVSVVAVAGGVAVVVEVGGGVAVVVEVGGGVQPP